MYCKASGKSCSGKTNIWTIFFGDTVSQGTFKHIYNVGPIKKFSRWGSVIRNNWVGGFKLSITFILFFLFTYLFIAAILRSFLPDSVSFSSNLSSSLISSIHSNEVYVNIHSS